MGVGLRRALADEFLLLRVNEFRTSSLCPTCHGPVVHPRVPVHHPHHAGDGEHEYREVHHLLRCPSINCKSQWWNRDALAVANISAKAHRVLHNQVELPAYNRA
ncbi:hypothetical protein BC828DRAFT_392026 [Blastocladiella britannica]|nr:hypothetical protein BC828DRAFT_392026 [Blastocladiella britannica]